MVSKTKKKRVKVYRSAVLCLVIVLLSISITRTETFKPVLGVDELNNQEISTNIETFQKLWRLQYGIDNVFRKNQSDNSYGYLESTSISQPKIHLFSNAINALSWLLAFKNTGMLSKEKLTISEALTEFIVRYFTDPYVRDRRGFVSFYDFNLGDDSYPRSQRKAVDQFLMLVLLDYLLSVVPSTYPRFSDYSILLEKTESFFVDYLADPDYFGWYHAALPINTTDYAIDTTKPISMILTIMMLYYLSSESLRAKLGESFKQKIFSTYDFITTHLKGNLGGIYYITDRTGTQQLQIYTAKTNALFGIVSVLLYDATNNSTYLNNAKNVFNFLYENLWDIGFSGLFKSVNSDGDLLVQAKDSTSNFLMAFLTYLLLMQEPNNPLYYNFLSQILHFIDNTFKNDVQHYTPYLSGFYYRMIATRQNVAFGSTTYESEALAHFVLAQLPYIIKFAFPSKVTLGMPIDGKIMIYNPAKINMTLKYYVYDTSKGTWQLLSAQNVSAHGLLNVRLLLPNTISPDLLYFKINLELPQIVLDEIYFTTKLGGTAPPVGNLFLLIIAGGAIMIAIFFIRSPPQFLVEIQKQLTEIQNVERETETSSTEENVSSKTKNTSDSET